MAYKTYIQFPTVLGESQDRVHLGWTAVDSWSLGAQQAAPVGHPVEDSFTFTSNDGISANAFRQAVTSGKIFDKVIFDAMCENGNLYVRHEMRSAKIAQYTDNAASYIVVLSFDSLDSVHHPPA